MGIDKGSIIEWVGIIMMVLLCAFLLYAMYTSFIDPGQPTEEINETNITQPTFEQVYVYCNYNIQNYTVSNPDYLMCDTRDQCDYKQLKLNVLQEQAFSCMKAYWDLRA